jgi:predicted aspartyl protease
MNLKTMTIASAVVAISATVVLVGQKVQLKDLPTAVQKTVQEETKSATLVGIGKEKEKGKTVYELETKVNGRTRDLMIDAAGRVYLVEEETALDSVPPAVKTALQSQGKLLRLETLTKGTAVTYEAQVEKNGKKSEVVVDAGGKPVKR